MVTLDLNERERGRFVDMAQKISKYADDLSIALRNGKDHEALVAPMFLSLQGNNLNELSHIFVKAAEKRAKEAGLPPSEETPGGQG